MKGVLLPALALLAFGTPAALAATTIDKSSVTAASEVTLTVDAPVEHLRANEKLTVDMPDGFRVLSCEPGDEFRCAHASPAGSKRTIVTWERTAPAQPVAFTVDQFSFRMRAIDKPGKHVFGVTQYQSDASVAEDEHLLQVTPKDEPPLVVTRASATVPTVRIHAAPASQQRASRSSRATPVSEPEWTGNTAAVPAAEIAVQQIDEKSSRAPLMVLLGAIAAMAALGVHWFRRRVTAED